jgi:DNA end-binding protein Ku
MHMPITHKGAISFGLVHIPVSLHAATQDSDIGFNQLHKADKSRIRYKKTCAHCGQEVRPEDIVKGYEYKKDQYVVITDEDLAKITTEKDRTINILHFASLDQISPIYYDRTYHLLPESGGEKALELMRRAMMESQCIAVGKTVMGNGETMLVIIPREDGILIQTLLFEDDIRERPKPYEPGGDLKPAELKMAMQLIEAMTEPFAPETYKNEYQEKLKDLIAQKISGEDVTAAKPPKESKIVDIMDALKASLEEKSTPKKKTAAKTRKKA